MANDDAARLADAVEEVRARIAAACARSGRSTHDVLLVAVSKTVRPERVLLACGTGLRDFGENRAVELARKAEAVASAPSPPRIRWHYLGRLQSGTIRHVVDHADVVHSAEPGHPLDALARRRSAGRPIEVLIEVDFTGRRQGVEPGDVGASADIVARLDGVRLTGLMTIAPFDPDPEAARPWFARLRDLRDGLLRRHPRAREISMGMSLDYEVAVEEGATMVRLGTALFGERPRQAAGPTHSGRTGGGPEGRPEA
jgi:pyridoxal phosphate enzyme (YggS family)